MILSILTDKIGSLSIYLVLFSILSVHLLQTIPMIWHRKQLLHLKISQKHMKWVMKSSML
jgi:hypothetical protein